MEDDAEDDVEDDAKDDAEDDAENEAEDDAEDDAENDAEDNSRLECMRPVEGFHSVTSDRTADAILRAHWRSLRCSQM